MPSKNPMPHSPQQSPLGGDSADPMRHNIVHLLLVTTQKLQDIPAWGVMLILCLLAGMVNILYQNPILTAITFLTMALNWLLLWLLPITNRSYGPDRPSALALAVLTVLMIVILQIFNVPLGLVIIPCGLMVAGVYYTTYLEPFRLGLTPQRLNIPQWQADVPPLRLLHIGDLHIERITQRERDLNAMIERLEPDIIVFSGDFVNVSYRDDARTEADIREIIGQWSAPLGVFCVGGTYTVESLVHVRRFTDGLDNLRLLVDEWVTVATPAGALHLLGMQTTHVISQDEAVLQQLWAKKPSQSGMTLLLTHAPDVAPIADKLGVDLYVCGHTHGGQIRLPFIGAIFTGSAYGKRYEMGRYSLSHTTLYTTRGIGLEGMGAPRARLLCPPEAVLWDIHGEGQ
jgi:predicted MPP superfamily phosphohydrolase